MKKPLIYISLLLFAVACSSGDEKTVDTRTVFKYNDMAGVSSLDPAAARNFENILAVNKIFCSNFSSYTIFKKFIIMKSNIRT